MPGFVVCVLCLEYECTCVRMTSTCPQLARGHNHKALAGELEKEKEKKRLKKVTRLDKFFPRTETPNPKP